MTIIPHRHHILRSLLVALVIAAFVIIMISCNEEGDELLPEGTEAGGPSTPEKIEIIADDGKLQFRWQPPKNTGLSEITRYEYDFDGRGQWKSMGKRPPFHVDDLVNDKTYMVRLRGVNSNASGVPSEGQFVVPASHRSTAKDRPCKPGGDGDSARNPYIICSYDDLRALHGYYKSKGSILETHVALGQHIDATPSHRQGEEGCVHFNGDNAENRDTCRGWDPLPSLRQSHFYGRGHIIFGLYSSQFKGENIGLFSEITHRTVIRDLHLRETHIYSFSRRDSYVGAIAGESYFDAVIEYSSVAGGRIQGPYVVGGLIGRGDKDAQVINSYVTGSEFNDIEIAGEVVGGVAGLLERDSMLHSVSSEAYVEGNYGDEDEIVAGGLVGELDDSSLLYSSSLSEVDGYGGAGGAVGYASNGARIRYTYSSGKIGGKGRNISGFCGATDGGNFPNTVGIYWDEDEASHLGGNVGDNDPCQAKPIKTSQIRKNCSSSGEAREGICLLGTKNGFRFTRGGFPEPYQCVRFCGGERGSTSFSSNSIFHRPQPQR